MLATIVGHLRRLRIVLERLHARDIGTLRAIVVVLPAAAFHRLYAKLAYWANRRFLDGSNRRRLRAFVAARLGQRPGHYFLIVMPRTLHFLLPCLKLLPKELSVTLVANGAQPWELSLLESRYPDRPIVRLATLPGSSIAHGDMIDMMLEASDEPFGILDHDIYVFDPSIFARLQPRERECMVGAMGDLSRRTGLAYPLTHLLVFNTPVLRELMSRFGVSARMYRKLPTQVKSKLANLRLSDGAPLKDYHGFFDTGHVLLGLGYAEGFAPRIERTARDSDIVHVGGTSIGTHHTKDLAALYIHAVFLELCGDPEIRRRYAYLIAPFESARQIRERIQATPEIETMLASTDELVSRLALIEV
jgi:hypothetical protein